MDEKFGLDFTVVGGARLKQLRRTHSMRATNPFTLYPRLIISVQWLRTLGAWLPG